MRELFFLKKIREGNKKNSLFPFFLIFLLNNNLFSQGLSLVSRVECWTLKDSFPGSKAEIRLYDALDFDYFNDNPIPKKIVFADDSGRFRIIIPKDSFYLIEVTRFGFVKKRFEFDARNVPVDQWKVGTNEFDIKGIILSIPDTSVDYSALNFPLVKVSWDNVRKSFDFDRSYSDMALTMINALKKIEQDSRAREKKEIARQKENLQKEGEKKRQSLFFIVISVISFSLLVIILFVIKSNKQKTKSNKLLTLQKDEIESQNKDIKVKQQEILDSIIYAKRIQNALITSEFYIGKNLNRLLQK